MTYLTSTSDIIRVVADAGLYGTWNPADKSSGLLLSNGNLKAVGSTIAGTSDGVRGNIAVVSGDKKFWSLAITNLGSGGAQINAGLANATANLINSFGSDTNSVAWVFSSTGVSEIDENGGTVSSIPTAPVTGDVVDIAVDYSNHKIWWRKNGGNWNNNATHNPATNTGGYTYSVSGASLYPAVNMNAAASNPVCQVTTNFGATAFTYAPPSGFTGFFQMGNIVVNSSWADNNAGTITPGRTNTPAITLPTTTTIVASPAASTNRSVRDIELTNNHATQSSKVKIQHYDGTNSVDLTPNVLLLPGETLDMDDLGRWTHTNSQSASYAANLQLPLSRISLSGFLAESFPREFCIETSSGPLSSGGAILEAVWLVAGMTVSNITTMTTNTMTTPTHWQFGLYNLQGALVAASADQLTANVTANVYTTLAMAVPYLIPKTGWYWVALTYNATSGPTLKTHQKAVSGASVTLTNLEPRCGGTTATLPGATLPSSLGLLTISGSQSVIWFGVS